MGNAQTIRPQTPVTAPITAETAKYASTGNYTDGAGAKHAWEITAAHALMWEGKPYLPTGGTFRAEVVCERGRCAWQADVKGLETLKAKGLTDILIFPDKPLIEVKATHFQRLIDWLEANGFRYGVGFGQGMTLPLSGAVIRPAYYRYEDPESLTATWQVKDSDTALTVIVEAGNGNAPLKRLRCVSKTAWYRFHWKQARGVPSLCCIRTKFSLPKVKAHCRMCGQGSTRIGIGCWRGSVR